MNRKKKIKEIVARRAKNASAKLHRSNKPRYVSKAEREKLALTAATNTEALFDETDDSSTD